MRENNKLSLVKNILMQMSFFVLMLPKCIFAKNMISDPGIAMIPFFSNSVMYSKLKIIASIIGCIHLICVWIYYRKSAKSTSEKKKKILLWTSNFFVVLLIMILSVEYITQYEFIGIWGR